MWQTIHGICRTDAEVSLELAAEYLVMAALLAEIKSRMLLPRPEMKAWRRSTCRVDSRLQEYERIKKAAEDIDRLRDMAVSTFAVNTSSDELVFERPQQRLAYKNYYRFAECANVWTECSHSVHREPRFCARAHDTNFNCLLQIKNSSILIAYLAERRTSRCRRTFLAMLEYVKDHLIEFVQPPLHLFIWKRTRVKTMPMHLTITTDSSSRLCRRSSIIHC